MQQVLLCLTALTLGLRHGADFDHVAAIADLVGSRVAQVSATPVCVGSINSARIQSCNLAMVYAAGHAAVVAILGISALLFSAILPTWIDPVMEKIVGITLVAMGIWMFFCLVSARKNPTTFVFQSRGMLLFSAFSKIKHWFGSSSNLHQPGEKHHHGAQALSQRCDWRCAATIGALHGIGAETGTQVILIASLAGTGDLSLSLSMLASFILGMLCSSVVLAVLVSEGYGRVLKTSRWVSIVGGLIATTSIITGLLFMFGRTDLVPKLVAD